MEWTASFTSRAVPACAPAGAPASATTSTTTCSAPTAWSSRRHRAASGWSLFVLLDLWGRPRLPHAGGHDPGTHLAVQRHQASRRTTCRRPREKRWTRPRRPALLQRLWAPPTPRHGLLANHRRTGRGNRVRGLRKRRPIARLHLHTTKIRGELGWEPRVSLRAGLAAMLDAAGVPAQATQPVPRSR
jgi:hypothetical protein